MDRAFFLLSRVLTFIGTPLFYLIATIFVVSVSLVKKASSVPLFYYVKRGINLTHEGVLWWFSWPLKFLLLFRQKKVFIPSLLILFGLLIFISGGLVVNLPNPGELTSRDQEFSTKIYDRHGNLLFKFYKNQNRTMVGLSELPLHVIQSTIAIEDSEFYTHHGFSVRGIVRSLWRNTTRGELTGGSTITQQLVKNALLTPEKTFGRKLLEVVTSVRVEIEFSKDEILEMYLNEVAYGGSAYGIEEAAQRYFNKGAHQLTLSESALLAGLPKAPTLYSPYGAPQLAKSRQIEVLARMVQEGFITNKQMEEAAAEELVFAPQRIDITAPHFVMYVRQVLADRLGEQMVEQGGLEVITTLDPQIQAMTEQVVAEEVEKIANLRISNGAALVTNPKNGEVLAMVGSKNYFDGVIDGNFNVTTAQRQPGSSIKPINYAYALESKMYTPASMISDTPITYWVPGSQPYSPRNYDNRFRGNVSLRTALGSSFNVPAVKVLASYGVARMIEQAQKMGVTTWNNPSRYGLSLTLGGGEVRMTDMAVAYGVFANYGVRHDLNPVLLVRDHKGRILEDLSCSKASGRFAFSPISRVWAAEAVASPGCSMSSLDPRVAFIITDILSDNEARIPAFGPNSLLNIPGHSEVAVKTGTTQNLRDNWAIGYMQDYVVAAWVGNNDNRPMAYVASGVTGATPIWHNIMKNLLEGRENHSWEAPSGLVAVEVCPITGTLPCEGCGGRTEYFLEGTQPRNHCNLEEYFRRLEEEKQREQTGEVLSVQE